MSNSPLVVYTNMSPNKNSPRQATIDTITIHCMAGHLSIESCGAIFAQSSRGASSTYGVGDDGRIGLYVDEGDRTWCTSSGSNDHRAVTIEVASDSTHPYAVTDEALAATIALCADICQRNGIPKLLWEADPDLIGNVARQNMTVHRWFAAKACPGDYLFNLHGYIADEVNKILEGEDEDEMDVSKFKELWAEMRQELQDNDASSYSEEARTWAVEQGLVQGGTDANLMWEDFLTREQLVTVLYRFAQTMGQG